VDAVMELLEVCLKTSYFQFGDTLFQQKKGMAEGSSLSPVVIKEVAIESAEKRFVCV
jgi:hypothetical protein